jgi:hypothetical protein
MTNRTKQFEACSLAGLAVLTVLLISAASLSGQVAGPNRPLQVPDAFVITPFGYFHPSCVLRLEEAETLLADTRLRDCS